MDAAPDVMSDVLPDWAAPPSLVHPMSSQASKDAGWPIFRLWTAFLRRSPPPPQASSREMLRMRYGQQSDCGMIGDVGLPDFCGPELAWHVEDAAVHQGGAAIAGSTHRYLCVRCWKPRFDGDVALGLTRWRSRTVLAGKVRGGDKSPAKCRKPNYL